MGKGPQPAEDMLCAPTTISSLSPRIFLMLREIRARALPQPAGGAPDQPLDPVIEVHTVNCRQATARDEAARSSAHPLPE